MVLGQDRQFGDAADFIEAYIDIELVAALFTGAHEPRVADFVRQIDLEPVCGIVPCDIGVEFLVRPLGERRAEFRLRDRDALRAVDFREAAGEHRLGFII